MPYLPRGTGDEILRLCRSRGNSPSLISEIRIRRERGSLIKISGESLPLFTASSAEDIGDAVRAMCDGALYAHRDSIRRGYVTLAGGIRVGICGRAGYDGEAFIGVSDVESLLYRIPTAPSSSAEQLYSAWREVRRGLLIYSPPGAGKTTALRSLVSLIVAREGLAVSVIDERCEFFLEGDCYGADVFRGYKKWEGIEIALRVMSPDVIVVDEIGGEGEAERMLESLNSGVRIIATTHAADEEEVQRRVNIAPMIENKIFDRLVGLSVNNGGRVAKIKELI